MSVSAELQKLVVGLLTADAAVVGLLKARVFDRVPEKSLFPYVSIGPSGYVDDDAECITGGEHTLQLDIWSRSPAGFLECKQVADAVKQALHLNETGALESHALGELRVLSVRFERDPDGLTSHGIVTLQALIEEAA